MNEQKILTNKIIAAVRNEKELLCASSSDVKIVFHLSPDIITLEKHMEILHSAGKKFFLHIDLASGIGKDKSGLEYIKKLGVDGVISTRTNIIKMAREMGIFTVQRFFIVDSQSIYTTIEALKTSKAHMIEIMPGSMEKVVKRLKETVEVPIIAGGLIENISEAILILKSGASAVSTGTQEMWFCEK